jgi:diadenylate cyclase
MAIWLLQDIKLFDVFDIVIVAFIFYQFAMLIRGTRAMQILLGLMILMFPLIISPWIQLNTIIWMTEKILPLGVLALLIIFQPEFRRGLEQIGRGTLLGKQVYFLGEEELFRVIDELKKAVKILSSRKIGAIIVLARETGLDDYIETGVRLKSLISAELLVNIFVPKTPLHDGAAIINKDSIEAASCLLPLTDNPRLEQALGTRHRAAIGITEVSDAVAVVVSEETGTISIAANGKINRGLDTETLERNLKRMLRVTLASSFWRTRPKKLFVK